MKKLILIFGILLCLPFLSFAQLDTLQKPKIYNTWIKSDRQVKRADILYQTKDSSIIVANYSYKRDLLSGMYHITKIGKYQTTIIEIGYKNIGTIEIRKTNSVNTGALSGIILGSLAGAIIGLSQGDDPAGFMSFSATDKAGIGAIIGGLSGLAIGIVVGSIRIKIPINRSIENFNKNKERLKKYSYTH